MMFSMSRFHQDQPMERITYNPNQTISSSQKKFYIKQDADSPIKNKSQFQHSTKSFSKKEFEQQVRHTFRQRLEKKKDFMTQSALQSTMHSSDVRTVEQIFNSTHMAFLAAPDDLLNKSLGKDYLTMKSFTPMSTILVNNQSWQSFAKRNQDQSNTREVMSNQLCFNRTQKNFLVNQAQKNYSENYDQLIDSYRKREQKFNLPKIKVKNHDQMLNNMAKQQSTSPIIGTEGNIIPQQQNEDDDDPFHNQNREQNEKKLTNLKFYWYCITDDGWRPETREYPSLTYIDGRLYLYGGMGLDLFNTMCYLDFQTWKWINMDQAAQLQEGRYGHTGHQYKKDLLVFGGEKKYNSHLKMRQCFNDIQIYEFSKNSWNQIRTFGDIIENRRNHASVIITKFLFIFGGINSYNKHLYDFVSVNLETFKCNMLQVEGLEKGLAFHQMTPVFRGDAKIENPYYNVEIKKTKDKKVRKVREEGLYVFGGLLQNGEATNQLRVIKLGQKPLKWVVPDVKGALPIARYQHSQHYYEDLNVLIIYGGRNDNSKYYRSYSMNISQNGILGDICILDLETLNWISVEENGLKNLQKCAFASSIIGSKIIIFGGYQEKGFVNADMYVLELDQQKNRKLIKESNNPLQSGFSKNCISIVDILNNHTDLFDIQDEFSKQKKKKNQLNDTGSKVELSDNEASHVLGMRTYQPIPQSILKNRKSSINKSFLCSLQQNQAGLKFKVDDNGIPSLNCVPEEEEDQGYFSTKSIIDQEKQQNVNKNKKTVSYAKI
ncbi:hypothetical protein ABPG72_015052 [Tetrahymena utriculariae]